MLFSYILLADKIKIAHYTTPLQSDAVEEEYRLRTNCGLPGQQLFAAFLGSTNHTRRPRCLNSCRAQIWPVLVLLADHSLHLVPCNFTYKPAVCLHVEAQPCGWCPARVHDMKLLYRTATNLITWADNSWYHQCNERTAPTQHILTLGALAPTQRKAIISLQQFHRYKSCTAVFVV
jgi:hypothetical protein